MPGDRQHQIRATCSGRGMRSCTAIACGRHKNSSKIKLANEISDRQRPCHIQNLKLPEKLLNQSAQFAKAWQYRQISLKLGRKNVEITPGNGKSYLG